jgi:hypothetical protein
MKETVRRHGRGSRHFRLETELLFGSRAVLNDLSTRPTTKLRRWPIGRQKQQDAVKQQIVG